MPFIGPELRQALGLMTNCPSQEDIAAACAARGLQLQPNGQLLPIPAARKAARQELLPPEGKAGERR